MADLDEATVERCRRVPTSTWSDVVDELGVGGVMDEIRWRSGVERIAGRAVCVREDVGPRGTFPWDAFDVGALLAAAGRGDVIVVGMAGATVSTFGGLAARDVTARGIAGVVIDGGCRDLREIQSTGLWLASRHVTPRTGKRRVRVSEVGGTVNCGGVEVSTGDIVIGDESGVVVVPVNRLAEALTVAEEREQREREFVKGIERGTSFAALASRLRHS